MAESHAPVGTKRRRSSSPQPRATRKRHVHHRLNHVQKLPDHVEPAPQTPVFAQGQLLRSLTAALVLAGFDSVEPSALEMFRSHTETYMLKLLSYIRESMQNGRRQQPTAQDFTMGLSLMPNAQTASLLQPQLGLDVPENVCCPTITDPPPSEPSPPDLSQLLAPLMEKSLPRYIPKHFPTLPPRHAWVETPVYTERETDPKKMRELSAQEGMMAEQALRKLAAAAKAGALKVEKRRSNALSGPGRTRHGAVRKGPSMDETFDDVVQEIDHPETDDTHNTRTEENLENLVVNYEMGQWRHGGGRNALRS